MSKPKPPAWRFQPAPKASHAPFTPADAERLADATADLGFSRASSAPETAAPAAAASEPEAILAPVVSRPSAEEAAPRHARSRTGKTAAHATAAAAVPAGGPALKFDVPDEVWTALKMEAIKRRVTVRYLVLEALARVGYAVNLATVPEDGRRLR